MLMVQINEALAAAGVSQLDIRLPDGTVPDKLFNKKDLVISIASLKQAAPHMWPRMTNRFGDGMHSKLVAWIEQL